MSLNTDSILDPVIKDIDMESNIDTVSKIDIAEENTEQ